MAEQVSAELREAAISGARWTFSSQLTREIAAFVASVLLARLVSPAEFGYAAVAMIVVALSAILGTAGCTIPLVQRDELTSRFVGAAVILCLSVAAVMTIATIVTAEALVRPVFGDRTAELTLLASPAWLLVAVGAPSHALLQRAFRFRRIAVVEASAALLGYASAVALAKAGAGGAAVVGGSLVLVGSTGLLSFAARPVRSFRTDRGAVGDLLGFATPAGLSSLVYIVYRNVDYAILGARTTPAQLGYYWRAWQLGVNYQSRISNVMQWVSLPVFSRASSAGELRAIYARIVRTHATVLVPLLAVFIGAAPVLIPWLFSSTWEPAVVPAQIMAVAGMAEAITIGVGPLLVALGRPGVLLRWNLVVLAVYAVTIFVLAPYGIDTVAVGVAGFGVLSVLGVQAFIRRPFAGLTFRDLWDETRAGILVAAGVLTVAILAREALEKAGLAPYFLLPLLGAVCLLTYAVLLRVFFAAEWRDLLTILRAVAGHERGAEWPDRAAAVGLVHNRNT